jgi:hypothetical protein
LWVDWSGVACVHEASDWLTSAVGALPSLAFAWGDISALGLGQSAVAFLTFSAVVHLTHLNWSDAGWALLLNLAVTLVDETASASASDEWPSLLRAVGALVVLASAWLGVGLGSSDSANAEVVGLLSLWIAGDS